MVCGSPAQRTLLKMYKDCCAFQIVVCGNNYIRTLFYYYNWLYTNCRDLSASSIKEFPINLTQINANDLVKFNNLTTQLMNDYRANSTVYRRVAKNIETKFDSFYPYKSKHIIDEIDDLLARHYGFTDEELDYIINYDIKYRMGDALNDEE